MSLKDNWQCACGCDNVSIISKDYIVQYKGFYIDINSEVLSCNHCKCEFQVAYQLKDQKEKINKSKAVIDKSLGIHN